MLKNSFAIVTRNFVIFHLSCRRYLSLYRVNVKYANKLWAELHVPEEENVHINMGPQTLPFLFSELKAHI
jgi:hypothetical protein